MFDHYIAGYRHSMHYEAVLRSLNSDYKRGGKSAAASLHKLTIDWNNINRGFEWTKQYAANDKKAALLCSLYPNAGTYLIHLFLPLSTRINWLETGAAAAAFVGEQKLQGFHLNNLGEAHYFAGRPQLAREFYLKALAINRELDDLRNAAQALGNLGVVSSGLGENEAAKNYFEEAVSIFEKTGDLRGSAAVYGDLGNIHKKEGNVEMALIHYRKKLEISYEIEDHRSTAQGLSSIGSVYRQIGNYEEARGYYEESLKIARRIGDRRLQGNALGGIGRLNRDLRKLDLALECFHQQLQLSIEVEYKRGQAAAYWNIGLTFHESGKCPEAVAHARMAHRIYKSIDHPFASSIQEQINLWTQD